MLGTEEASKLWKGESVYNPWSHISYKELTYLLQSLLALETKYYLHAPREEVGRSQPSRGPDCNSTQGFHFRHKNAQTSPPCHDGDLNDSA